MLLLFTYIIIENVHESDSKIIYNTDCTIKINFKQNQIFSMSNILKLFSLNINVVIAQCNYF